MTEPLEVWHLIIVAVVNFSMGMIVGIVIAQLTNK